MSKRSLAGKWQIITMIVALGVLYWITDSFIEVFILGKPSLKTQIFSPAAHNIWMRLMTISVLIFFGVLAQYLISGYKRTASSLKDSEERYRSLFDNAHDLIQSIAPDGKIIYVNPAWLRTMGYSLEELRNMTVFDILHPNYRDSCLNTLQQVLSGGTKDNIEAVFISKDGRLVNVEGNANVQLVDGKAVACNGIFRDVTERKRMEEQIFQITHDWEDTFNTITDMITIHDKDFNIIHANKPAEKILGLPILNVSPAKCYQFYHGTGSPPAVCPSCDCLKTGMSSTTEIYEPHLKMFIEIRAIPRLDSNHNLIGLIHVARDITERKKLEDQLRQAQKMEAIGQLAGGIAHDFNNMLTAIIGYANILKIKMGADNPLKINIDQILAASERGAYLTQSLLAFSRQQISNPDLVTVNEIIRKIETLLLRVIGEDIELKTIYNEDLTVMADRVQMEQVLMNLCTNARDAMPHGGILTIETGRIELDSESSAAHGIGKPGNYSVISVSDSGTGMDKGIQERIFEPFFTTKDIGKGTGLGLSIVYGIIKQHNGYINCYSEPGKGTKFKMYLPIVKSTVKETLPAESHDLKDTTATILLAEDEPAVRKLTSQILKEFGHEVIEAVDGEDAEAKFLENKDKIDLLIFDVIMPKMNGKIAYDRIKAVNPDIKALFTSGYPADFVHRQEIIDEGLNFVSKPISPAGLLRKVKEVLAI
ncbi:MAG: MEKHLA domain-containing protein [Nitrospiraceae bacterium]|nr:MAG: MEKHLA domain-containing protein [Nitrospiraceae bacterium]